MRLLNVESRKLEEFEAEKQIPLYAILSHTWGKTTDEVKLQDLEDPDVTHKPGYRKIEYCCKQAECDGLEWAWIDTCCIDKTNPAELSEAINSMFRWYRAARVCYAYLADVEDDALDGNPLKLLQFVKSAWFARGWTLQELIAPSNVVFYSQNWRLIGTKKDMASSGSLLSKATGIDNKFLMENLVLHNGECSPSIAQIMSWAAKRTTKKTEDMAYCLLGLLDINMPLLYGEGGKAFLRLQEELLKVSDDHTLFAWGMELKNPLPSVDLDIPYNPSLPTTGMLAPTPSEFCNSGNITRKLFPWMPSGRNGLDRYISQTAIVYRGVRIELPIIHTEDEEWFSNTDPDLDLPYSGPELANEVVCNQKFIFAVIACSIDSHSEHYLGIPLSPILKLNGETTGHFRRLRMRTVLIPRDSPGLNHSSFTLLHIEAL